MRLIEATVMKRDPSLTCYDVMIERGRYIKLVNWLDSNKLVHDYSSLPGSNSKYCVERIVCTPEMFTLLTLSFG